jgi:hypothetical protein
MAEATVAPNALAVALLSDWNELGTEEGTLIWRGSNMVRGQMSRQGALRFTDLVDRAASPLDEVVIAALMAETEWDLRKHDLGFGAELALSPTGLMTTGPEGCDAVLGIGEGECGWTESGEDLPVDPMGPDPSPIEGESGHGPDMGSPVGTEAMIDCDGVDVTKIFGNGSSGSMDFLDSIVEAYEDFKDMIEKSERAKDVIEGAAAADPSTPEGAKELMDGVAEIVDVLDDSLPGPIGDTTTGVAKAAVKAGGAILGMAYTKADETMEKTKLETYDPDGTPDPTADEAQACKDSLEAAVDPCLFGGAAEAAPELSDACEELLTEIDCAADDPMCGGWACECGGENAGCTALETSVGDTAYSAMACPDEDKGEDCSSVSVTVLGDDEAVESAISVCGCPLECTAGAVMMPGGPSQGDADCSGCAVEDPEGSLFALCAAGVPMPPGLIGYCGTIDPMRMMIATPLR